jgi:hypothetical protein
VGSETVGSETVGDEKLTLPLADTLGKALLTPPLTQPAARYPAARIARATPSVLVICRPFRDPPSHSCATPVSFRRPGLGWAP